MDRIIKATLIISIIRIFDMITTYLGVTKFGIGAELNPLLSIQVSVLGGVFQSLIFHYFFGIVLTYFAFVLIDNLDLKRMKKNKKSIFNKSMWTLAIVFSLAVINNTIQYLI